MVSWIQRVVRPKIRNILSRREVPDNLWVKCPATGRVVFRRDLEANYFVVPGSDYHMRMGSIARLSFLFDDGVFEEISPGKVPWDPLGFQDGRRYSDRLREAQEKTGLQDAVKAGRGALDGLPIVAAVQDFDFMGGSLGMAAGQMIFDAMMTAVEMRSPFIMFTASGGARMQEGILSLMQMPKTTAAVLDLRDVGSPYIVVFTNPTMGGVTASYGMLGDVHIAEPGALIGFTGPRVIEQTMRQQLPQGFQRAEYLHDHGMVDMIVHRHRLRPVLSKLCRMLLKAPEFEGKLPSAEV